MKRPAYPRTKPSGVEWLGDVPEHWELNRFGYLFRFFSGGTPSTDDSSLWDGDLPWVSSKDMKSMVITDTEDHISEDAVRKSATCKLPAGSLLMVNRSGILRHSIPVAIIAREMAINQDIRGCVPSGDVDAKFIAYLIDGNQKQLLPLWRQQGATVESLSFDSVKATTLFLPATAEQRAIVAFLDRDTGRVDRLVAKKRELIERLKEKRTALISRTVTCGLPPAAARAAGLPINPSLKPSGVEWLGEIPKHWEVVPLGYLVRFSGGATPDKSNSAYWDGSIPWVSPKDMKVARIADAEDHVSPEALANSALRLMPVDSVLIVVRGMILAHSFPVALTTAPVTINQDMKAVACGKRVTPHFLSWSFTGFAKTFVSFADESAHGTRKLETGTLTRFPFLLPPLPEQAAIAAYLDEETAKLDALVGKVEEAVERLQEYRTALITAAVTGKIDVRKVVAA